MGSKIMKLIGIVCNYFARQPAVYDGACMPCCLHVQHTPAGPLNIMFACSRLVGFLGEMRTTARIMSACAVYAGRSVTGDGTGGESIWGGEFEDEFHKTLRHDRPGILSMVCVDAGLHFVTFLVSAVLSLPCMVKAWMMAW